MKTASRRTRSRGSRSFLIALAILAMVLTLMSCGTEDTGEEDAAEDTTEPAEPAEEEEDAQQDEEAEVAEEEEEVEEEEPVVNWIAGGGASRDGHFIGCLDSFEEETGITVNYIEGNVSLGALVAEVEAPGPPAFDTGKIPYEEVEAAIDGDYLEPLDWDLIDIDTLSPEVYEHEFRDYALIHNTFGGAVFYNTNKWSGDEAPETWADFWDVERFPGPRSMDGSTFGPPFRYQLEAASMASGIPAAETYPIDVDAAIAKLDEIQPHVTLWYDSGATITQSMLVEEVDMIFAWVGRAYDAVQQGAPYEILPQTHITNRGSPMVIPKGAEHPRNATRAIAHCATDEAQAGYADVMVYAPFPASAAELMDEELVEGGWVQTDPRLADTTVLLGLDWYEGQTEELRERWQAWLTQ